MLGILTEMAKEDIKVELRCRRCNKTLTAKTGHKRNDAVWDFFMLYEWRKHTGDPRTMLDGVKLAWCRTCHRISRKSESRFLRPTKEVKEILKRLGVKVVETPVSTETSSNEHRSPKNLS